MARLPAICAVVGALALGALGAAGCGDGGVLGEPATGTIHITYVPEPERTPREADLACPADDPDGRMACEQIESLSGAFDPVPGDRACTEIYGGPEQITLVGTWAGEPVDTILTRTNGCEIDRYESLAPVLLPLVGGPGGG